jgi:hypothetical protein
VVDPAGLDGPDLRDPPTICTTSVRSVSVRATRASERCAARFEQVGIAIDVIQQLLRQRSQTSPNSSRERSASQFERQAA